MSDEFHDDLKKIVISHLRRTGQGVFHVNGSYMLATYAPSGAIFHRVT